MNQELNNFNQNNFNTQGNNGMPNNQSLNNINTSQQQFVNQPQQVSSQNIQANISQPISMPISNENLQSTIEQVNSTISQNTNYQNDFVNQQPVANNINDEDLVKAFIGNNYDKITTRTFNFAGFFFTTFYMFYRKMFLYGILFFLVNLVVLNVINSFIINLLFCVAVGFLVNKVYLYYVKKKIEKIKFQNSGKDINEIKGICISKGGTSIGQIFLGLLTEIGITIVVLFGMLIIGVGSIIGETFNIDNWNIIINSNENDVNDSNSNTNGILVEDIIVVGSSCFNSKCNVSIEKSNNTTDYVLSVNNSELFKKLGNYSDYIKVNIYYAQKGDEKTIVNYKIYVKSTNEDISDVSTESELRDKVGLYSIGNHTDSFTLKEIGMTGIGYENNTSYTYTDYTFVDSKNNEYKMKYIISDAPLNLIEGNTYTVTFEVVEGIFDYEYNIKTIK